MTRGRHSIAGAKLLITAAAVASTFGGWVALASEQMAVAQAPPPASDTASIPAQVPVLVPAPAQAQVTDITMNSEVLQLRTVDTPPAPITTTRSSR